jgi:hypothetical protein
VQGVYDVKNSSIAMFVALQPVIFKSLIAWNCEKGAESVNTGAIQFKDFILINNEKAGHEMKLLGSVPQYDEVNGPMIDGGMVVAHINNE